MLQGEKYEGVAIDALKTVLFNVIGVTLGEKEREETEEGGEEKQNVSNFGFYDDDMKFFIRKGEHSRIFSHFKSLYINRMQHLGHVKKYSRNFDQSQLEGSPNSKPMISEKSSQMA